METLDFVRKEDLVPREDKKQQTAIKPNLPAAVPQIGLGEARSFDRNAEFSLQSEYLPSMQARAENLTIDEALGCVEAGITSYHHSIRRVILDEHANKQVAASMHRDRKGSDKLDTGSKSNPFDFNMTCSIVDPFPKGLSILKR